MTANNFAANAFTNGECFNDIVNLCGMFETILKKQAAGLPGYSNTEINNYCFAVTSTVSNGGLGGTSGSVGNSSVKGWVANAAMIQLCNTFYSSVAQT